MVEGAGGSKAGEDARHLLAHASNITLFAFCYFFFACGGKIVGIGLRGGEICAILFLAATADIIIPGGFTYADA